MKALKAKISATSPEGFAHGTKQTYIIGFVLSLILTFIPYFLVTRNIVEGWPMVYALLFFAVGQLLVQVVYFLHLGKESMPKWNEWVFMFMIFMVLCIVLGSLWIMKNLDYHHGSHTQSESEIIEDEGLKP